MSYTNACLKAVSSTNNVYFADFETLTFNSKDFQEQKHTDVYKWYIKSKDGDFEAIGTSMSSFFDTIMKLDNPIIYFHNLSFDGNFIKKYLIKHYNFLNIGFEELTKDLTKLYPYFTINETPPKIYSIFFFINKEQKIIFKCSYNLLQTSIHNLGKNIDTPKFNHQAVYNYLKKKKLIKKYDKIAIEQMFYDLGSYDMDPEFDGLLSTYIKSDVEIARLSYIQFEKDLQGIEYFKRLDKPLTHFQTLSHLTYSMFKQSFDTKKYDITTTSDNYDYLKKFQRGGFTSFNEDYEIGKGAAYGKWSKYNGLSYDINSSYPYQMTKDLPYGEMLFTKPKGKYLEYVEVEVAEAIIKPQYTSFLPMVKWSDKSPFRYLAIQVNFKCYYTKMEWDLLNEIYFIKIKSIKSFYFKAAPYARDYINFLYKFKEQASKDGDKGKKQTYKILLNSLYGKMCQRKSYPWVIYKEHDWKSIFQQTHPNNFKIKKRRFKELNRETRYKFLNLEGVMIEKIPFENEKFPNIIIGATITSYGRIQLMNALKLIIDKNLGIPLYWDTDSIKFITDNRDIEKYLPIDPTALGAWGFEYEFKQFWYSAAKRYCFMEPDNTKHTGLAGVNKSIIECGDMEQFLYPTVVLPEGKTARAEDDYGIYFLDKEAVLKQRTH